MLRGNKPAAAMIFSECLESFEVERGRCSDYHLLLSQTSHDPAEGSKRDQLSVFFALLGALAPLSWLVVFYAYVAAARLKLGHWPSYGNPDPKQMGWDLSLDVLRVGLLQFPWLAIATAIFVTICRLRNRRFPFWRLILVTVLASSAFILLMRLDPGRYVEWFWD